MTKGETQKRRRGSTSLRRKQIIKKRKTNILTLKTEKKENMKYKPGYVAVVGEEEEKKEEEGKEGWKERDR